jgi:glycerol uptake facilitator-like aquaporin
MSSFAHSKPVLHRPNTNQAPLYSIRDALHPSGFLVLDNWKMAVVEGIGTCLLVFALGAGASGLTTLQVSPMAISLYAALLNSAGLSLFIFTAAPASGGHLNPSITMATFFAGLSTRPRSVLYIVAQTLGAIVAGYWLKLGLGEAFFPVVSIQTYLACFSKSMLKAW